MKVLETYLPADYPRPVAGEETKLRDEVAFEASGVAYKACGLEQHPAKAKRGVDCASFWGIEVEGRHGLAGPPRHKLAALLVLWSLHVLVSARAKCWIW